MTDAVLCICCPVLRLRATPRRPNTPQVCDGCRARLAAELAGIPDAYALVDAEPGRAALEVLISGRAFESRPPLNIAALSLLGPGSLRPAQDGCRWPQDQLGDPPPLVLLDFWAQDWAGIIGKELPGPTVTELCRWLGVWLTWACDNHPAVDGFAYDIRDLSRQLRAYGGRDHGEPVGRCPRNNGGDRCNTALYVDPYVDEIECSRCHMKWKRKAGEWMHLRAQQLAAGVEAA
jgi:hypothetical protein